ncbi:hypothetical protein CVD25_22120 [Bacillus canaveralius]|uniref:Uncharacterized protein n=1 Tax=Bacillus canaveralius TaxID=1403243 RepID=A0ABX4SXQ3_9BACI|nr:hypothetical protein CVD25_22120 [Bacillus canaveralius]
MKKKLLFVLVIKNYLLPFLLEILLYRTFVISDRGKSLFKIFRNLPEIDWGMYRYPAGVSEELHHLTFHLIQNKIIYYCLTFL